MEEKARRLPPLPPPCYGVVEFTKLAQEKGIDPVAWAIHVSSMLRASGVELPSPDVADAMVSHICWANDVPAAWKYLEMAVSSGLAPPMLVVALLSTRVIPSRRMKPIAYRLYMEIVMRHTFSFPSQINDPSFKRILMLVNDFLHLSKSFGVQSCETGILIVEFIFCIIWQLLEATLDDEGLLRLASEKNPRWVVTPEDVHEIGNLDDNRNFFSERLVKANTVMAIELIGKFLHHKVISRLLSLAHQNMPSHWQSFSSCLHLLATNSCALQTSTVPSETLINWSCDNFGKVCRKYKPSQYRDFSTIFSGPLASPGSYCHGSSRSAIWVPLDLYLEDSIDGSVAATNSIKIISGLVKTLKAVNKTTWHDTFLGLWMAALRLIQRARDPIEGPVPQQDTRLCMLLSVTTLSVADVIREEESTINDQIVSHSIDQSKEKVAKGERHKALVSSLQSLGEYESLLVPPPYVASVANQAAAKAMAIISGMPVANRYFESTGIANQLNCSGNMWHLIVEACIARNLLETSAYFWPGYANGHVHQIPHNISAQGPGWSTLMIGSPLTPSVINACTNIPASSLAELEKVFEIAFNGSDEDRICAATILCGASLIRGWNIQEYAVHFVLKLLSPPAPVEYSGTESHLISHAPVLDVLLAGISSVDCVQVFSFHGLVPELAGALMAISEVFGSHMPNKTWTLSTGEIVSAHTVFSNAFILLLRLWEFNHTPLEFILVGNSAPVGSQLTPEYLLLLRNAQVMSSCDGSEKKHSCKHVLTDAQSANLIFVDSFSKLKVWYCQHQSCLASTLSGLVPGTPVHQNVDSLLSMMFRKISRGANLSVSSATSGSSNLSGSSVPVSEDSILRPKLPAWDIMEAVPYVVDAALTACAHGRLSPRELATGLKELADFLPASLATIVSYFSAEVTRGVWKPADMNGTDWPSPAANLPIVEENIKKIVAATGVDVPSVAKDSSRATLPLPLAAFVSLTITYKLDRASERFLNLAGPALENLAGCCPWPSMEIVAALWTQKVKRWTDFLTFSASRSVFIHNKNAVSQLLKSCFSAFLGISATLDCRGGVGSLLGHGFSSHISSGLLPVAPGILYLRVYRSIRDVMFLTEEILSLLIVSVRELVDKGIPNETWEKLSKSKNGKRYGQVSLISAFTQVKTASYLGATLVWLSGGCGLTQCMFLEILPSWFLSVHNSGQEGQGGMVAMLEGYTLAHFSMLCAMFAWGIDSTSLWKRRPKVIGAHLQFMADAMDGNIFLGCHRETWHAYVSGFLGLVVDCAPNWLLETDVTLLKRLSVGLRQWDEEDLALLLLGKGGISAMGAAAELIISGH